MPVALKSLAEIRQVDSIARFSLHRLPFVDGRLIDYGWTQFKFCALCVDVASFPLEHQDPLRRECENHQTLLSSTCCHCQAMVDLASRDCRSPLMCVYCGRPWTGVPSDYFDWLVTDDRPPDVVGALPFGQGEARARFRASRRLGAHAARNRALSNAPLSSKSMCVEIRIGDSLVPFSEAWLAYEQVRDRVLRHGPMQMVQGVAEVTASGEIEFGFDRQARALDRVAFAFVQWRMWAEQTRSKLGLDAALREGFEPIRAARFRRELARMCQLPLDVMARLEFRQLRICVLLSLYAYLEGGLDPRPAYGELGIREIVVRQLVSLPEGESSYKFFVESDLRQTMLWLGGRVQDKSVFEHWWTGGNWNAAELPLGH